MDNLTEENMEKSDKHITAMEEDSSEDYKSLLFTGYDDIRDLMTYSQIDSFPYPMDNEPRIMVEGNMIDMPEQQNTVSVDLEDDSKIEIYDKMGQIKKNIIPVATKNNLFTRKTGYDFLNVNTFFIPKKNTSSNPLVKLNQTEILSTATVNIPKTTMKHSQPKSSSITEIGHDKSFSKPNHHNKMFSERVLRNASRIEKYIPHTITSADLMGHNSNTFVQNDEVKINTNCPQKLDASSSQQSSNSETLNQSDSSLLSYGQMQWAGGNGKITENDQLLSLGSFTKSKTKLNSNKMLKNGANDSNDSNLNIRRAIKEHSNKNTVLLSEEIINLNDQSKPYDEYDMSNQFTFCKFEYCDILVYAPELIDKLYCSLACKHLDVKKIVSEEEQLINKSTVDGKQNSKKSEMRISKRKQLFPCSKDMVKVNDNGNKQLKHVFNNPSKEKNQSSVKPFLPMFTSESIDAEYVDLKLLIEDKDELEYMIRFQMSSAPKELFDTPFPTKNNYFAVGQKLEGIDPKHAALFCVMTVSEVCGYRIKLHFDGYDDDYDFWVNADCPDLFYPGWCKLNLRILQPPKDYGNKFDWSVYLRECQALPAPTPNFVSTKNLNSNKIQHQFHIGGKLEALDKLTRVLSTQLIRVATVVDILGNRIRIHFDGWTDDLDYWVNISSTNIHPIMWCFNNDETLTPPKGFKDRNTRKTFNWHEYLKEKKCYPIPENAFVHRPLRDFSYEMIIEVVDLVVPRLLRIARVVDVRNNELKIIYDGFEEKYEYWVEDDSPDIHPVGWSSQTNHPIEIPPAKLWNCLIPGCKGYGNSSNSLKIDHEDSKDCPYEIDSWKTAVAGLGQKTERLKTSDVLTTPKLER